MIASEIVTACVPLCPGRARTPTNDCGARTGAKGLMAAVPPQAEVQAAATTTRTASATARRHPRNFMQISTRETVGPVPGNVEKATAEVDQISPPLSSYRSVKSLRI